jgi:hypothetical protein
VGPVDDKPQIVYGDADFEKVIEGKLSHDLTGHYNRFDVFTLQMRTSPRTALDAPAVLGNGLALLSDGENNRT